MSRQRRASVILDAEVKPFEKGLRDAEGLLKNFEKKASKSGFGHGYRGRDKSVGGIFAGAGGGGAAGTARAFFGGWLAAEAMEAAINSVTIGLRAYQFQQAKAEGDLDKMSRSAIEVARAQEQLASSFPVLGRSISRLMRVLGGTEQLEDAMRRRQEYQSQLAGVSNDVESLRDTIQILEMVLSGASDDQVARARMAMDHNKALDHYTKEEAKARKNLQKEIEKRDRLQVRKDAVRRQDAFEDHRGMYMTGAPAPQRQTGAVLESRLANLNKSISVLEETLKKAEERRAKAERDYSLRRQVRHAEARDRAIEFIDDQTYEVNKLRIQMIERQGEDHEREYAMRMDLLDLEKERTVRLMEEEMRWSGEIEAALRLFEKREAALLHEYEKAAAENRERMEDERRQRQRQWDDAAARGTTRAFVSMSGAVTVNNTEQQIAQNTAEMAKEMRKNTREAVRTRNAIERAEFRDQAQAFRRERLN